MHDYTFFSILALFFYAGPSVLNDDDYSRHPGGDETENERANREEKRKAKTTLQPSTALLFLRRLVFAFIKKSYGTVEYSS